MSVARASNSASRGHARSCAAPARTWVWRGRVADSGSHGRASRRVLVRMGFRVTWSACSPRRVAPRSRRRLWRTLRLEPCFRVHTRSCPKRAAFGRGAAATPPAGTALAPAGVARFGLTPRGANMLHGPHDTTGVKRRARYARPRPARGYSASKRPRPPPNVPARLRTRLDRSKRAGACANLPDRNAAGLTRSVRARHGEPLGYPVHSGSRYTADTSWCEEEDLNLHVLSDTRT